MPIKQRAKPFPLPTLARRRLRLRTSSHRRSPGLCCKGRPHRSRGQTVGKAILACGSIPASTMPRSIVKAAVPSHSGEHGRGELCAVLFEVLLRLFRSGTGAVIRRGEHRVCSAQRSLQCRRPLGGLSELRLPGLAITRRVKEQSWGIVVIQRETDDLLTHQGRYGGHPSVAEIPGSGEPVLQDIHPVPAGAIHRTADTAGCPHLRARRRSPRPRSAGAAQRNLAIQCIALGYRAEAIQLGEACEVLRVLAGRQQRPGRGPAEGRYNLRRLHNSLRYRSPAEYETALAA